MKAQTRKRYVPHLAGLATVTVLAATVGGESVAIADGDKFDPNQPATRRVVPAGTFQGGKVEIELLAQPGGSDHQSMRINVLRHAPDGTYAMHQTLIDDVYCTSPFSATGDGKTIVIAYTVGKYSNDQYVEEWELDRYSYKKKRSYRRYPYREQAREVEQLLAAGKLDQALQRLAEIDVYVDSANRSLAPYWFMRFVAAVRPRAAGLHRAGKKRQAAALLANVLNNDLFSGVRHEPADLLDVDLSYFPCCEDGYDERHERRGRGPFKKTLYELNEAGYLLQQGGRNRDAVTLLTPLVAKVPERTVAHLNLADALWDLNQVELARRHYRTYAQQRRKARKSVPKRVLQRLGQ